MTIRIELIVAGIILLGGGFGWGVNKVISAIKELIDVVTEARIAMSALKEDAKNLNTNCATKHFTIDTRLNNHSAKIEAHGIILAEHEVKFKNLSK